MNSSDSPENAPLRYLTGFGNEFASEAIAGSLPHGQNSPRRAANRRSWLYRRQPSVVAGSFSAYAQPWWKSGYDGAEIPPEPLRWNAFPIPAEGQDFIDGVRTAASCGNLEMQAGMAAHIYAANRSMERRLCQCRRRDAVRSAAGQAAQRYRVRHH